MNRNELVEKLGQIYVSEKLERIREVVSEIPELVLSPVQEITRGHNGPLGIGGTPACGEYKEDTKTIILYEDALNPEVLFHEIGHAIYHELPGISEITDCEYRKDGLDVLETTGEGLSWKKGAAEFCANAYQLYKTKTISTDEDHERFRSLADKLKEKGV